MMVDGTPHHYLILRDMEYSMSPKFEIRHWKRNIEHKGKELIDSLVRNDSQPLYSLYYFKPRPVQYFPQCCSRDGRRSISIKEGPPKMGTNVWRYLNTKGNLRNTMAFKKTSTGRDTIVDL